MKVNHLWEVAPDVRTPGRGVGGRVAATLALPATALAFVAATLLAGAALAAAVVVVPETLHVVIAWWVAALVAPFALPFAVVRGVVAVLERVE